MKTFTRKEILHDDSGFSIKNGKYELTIKQQKLWLSEEFLLKSEVLKILDDAEKSSGFVGIGEWQDEYDIYLMLKCFKELRNRITGEDKK
jgi:hypothetical protein